VKELLGPLEVRRRLVREEKGFREKWVDRISEWVSKSEPRQPEANAAPYEGKTLWVNHTRASQTTD
jgi:hypothetical protein